MSQVILKFRGGVKLHKVESPYQQLAGPTYLRSGETVMFNRARCSLELLQTTFPATISPKGCPQFFFGTSSRSCGWGNFCVIECLGEALQAEATHQQRFRPPRTSTRSSQQPACLHHQDG
jgi:hypothetical protein